MHRISPSMIFRSYEGLFRGRFPGDSGPFYGRKRLMLLRLGLLLISVLVAGCQSLPGASQAIGAISSPKVSGDPCRNADWFEVGRIDGLTGTPMGNSTYMGRCRAQGIDVNDELYAAGWNRGLVEYCTPVRAFDAGRTGQSYSQVCPPHLEPEFLKRFHLGAQISKLEKRNSALESEVDRRLEELADLEKPTTENRGILTDALERLPEMMGPNTTTLRQQREALLKNEIDQLRDLHAKNEVAIRELESSAYQIRR